jgi:ParB family chromosome partitioning protein
MSDEATPKRRNLGRGLSALLGEDENDLAELDKLRSTKAVPVEFLRPGRFQPRHGFDEDRINDLVESIREKGILQPILVRRHPDDRNTYEIIAGERRWRAAQLAQLHEVPVIVKELSDREALEVALVENLQRQDLSALEEAEGYRRLMEEFAHSQEELAKSVGKSRSHVANMMRLLALPDEVKTLVESGKLSAGHARALLNAADPASLAKKVVAKGLNVRQTEKLAQSEGGVKGKKGEGEKGGKAEARPVDADTLALERDLANLLGLKVQVRFHSQGGGELTIRYETLEQLDDVLHRLSQKPAAKAEEDEFGDELLHLDVHNFISETDLVAGDPMLGGSDEESPSAASQP